MECRSAQTVVIPVQRAHPASMAIADCLRCPSAQFTEAKILSEFIKTDAYKMEVQARPPMAVTNAVSWRSEGIKYKKNEARTAALRSWLR